MSPITELLETAKKTNCDVEVYTSAQDVPFCGKLVELESDFVTVQGCVKLSVVLLSHVIAASLIRGADNI